MNGTHVIVASHTSFMTWQYSVPKSHSTSVTNSKLLILHSLDTNEIHNTCLYPYFSVKRNKVKMFHIDDTPSGVDELTQESSEFKSSSFQKVNNL